MKTIVPRVKLSLRSILILVFALTILDSFAQCTDPPAGLVAWWPAEGNANDMVGTNHGTLQNGAAYATGQVGQQAFSFDGSDDYVLIPDAPSLQPTNLTIEGWFNFSSLGGIQNMVSKTFGTGWHESFVLYVNDGLLVAAAGGENQEFIMYDLNPATNVWYHIAYTFDDTANIQRLYVNGATVVSNANNYTITYDSHPLMLGAEHEQEVVSYYFNGMIDEASVYSRALASNEIAAIHAAGRGGKCSESGVPATIRVSQVEICWNSQTNTRYQVQYRSDLTTNVWAPLIECVPGSISNTCVTDPVLPGMPRRFYRVVLTNCVPTP